MANDDYNWSPCRIVVAMTEILGVEAKSLAAQLQVSVDEIQSWRMGIEEPNTGQKLALQDLLNQEMDRAIVEAHPDEDNVMLRDSHVGNVTTRLRAVLALLHVEYGSAPLGDRSDPLDELFLLLVKLKSARRRDEESYERLRGRFYPWRRLLDSDMKDIESYIRQDNLGSIKIRAFVDIARRLQADFGEVSLKALESYDDDRAEKYLTSLPGVGLKTARRVLMYSLGRDRLPVDACTYRVGVRIGLVPTSRNTADVHYNFDKVIPPRLAYYLHSNFNQLGDNVCIGLTPRCEVCVVRKLCAYGTTYTGMSSRDRLTDAPTDFEDVVVIDRPTPEVRSTQLRCVDIYAGCGGLSSGLRDAGVDVAYALDWDPHACMTHAYNSPETVVECTDVRQVSGTHIEEAVGGTVDIVVGGPNCQGVSERGLRNPDDPRNFMFPEFVRLVSELRPRAFIMENVPGLAHRHNFDLLRTVFQSFENLGYHCAGDVLLAARYGVPQLRYRFFLIGLLSDEGITLPMPTYREQAMDMPSLFDQSFVTTWDAIGDLPEIDAKRQQDILLPYATSAPANNFQRYARKGSEGVLNHICSATSDINLIRASFVPEGGNWKDIPATYLPERFFRCRMTDHSTTYARLRRDQPSYTVTALFGNITAGAFTHPLSNRALSIREGARLQSFRDTFIFQGPRNSQYRQIGNAVPPLLAKAIGEHLIAILQGKSPIGVRPRISEEVLSEKRAWDGLPVLTPRFKESFGKGTRWPRGWGEEPADYALLLDDNYTLRTEFWPSNLVDTRRKLVSGTKA